MKTAFGFVLVLGLAVSAAPAVIAAPPATSSSPAPTQKLAKASHQAFVLLEFDVKDPPAFKDFASNVRATLKDFKGDFVMREKVDSLFGGKASNLSVISFPTVDDARKWLDSPEIAKLNEQRDKIASVRTYLVEKMD